MPVQRRSRVVAGAGVLAAVSAVGVGAVVAPSAASAPVPAAPVRPAPAAAAFGSAAHALPAAAEYPHVVRRTAVTGSGQAAVLGAPVRAATVRAARTRLTLAVRPVRGRLQVTGVLTRASSGTRVQGRTVQVWTRTADTGTWRLRARLRTSARGAVAVVLKDDPLLQVTLRFAGDSRFGPAASVTLVPEPGPARGLDQRLVAALGRARAAARRAGLTLVLNSGYRTWAKQQRMYDAAVRRYGSPRIARQWVLPPQESTHVRGLAVDLGTPAAAAWLQVHGAAFGLCRTYGDEPWHFEYRPDWVRAFHGSCPRPVPLPGDPDPFSPKPRVAVVF
jgi:hypothetical protein